MGAASPPAGGNTAVEAVRGLRRVLSLRFQAGAITVFIRWRGAAERRAGFCPSLGLGGGCRFLFVRIRLAFRLARSLSLSVGAGLPSAAPDFAPEPWTGRLPISVWRIRLAAAAEPWGQRRRRRAGNTAVRGAPPCALSQISGWRDHCLYPLARGCRAPRRILPEPWTGRLPISVWRIRLAFRLARSLSLSVGAGLPSAAPDSARALDWAAADFCLANSVGGGGRAMGSASPPAGWQHRGEGSSAVCSLSDFRLARSLSLSVGAGLPSAAPDSARALDWAAADFCLANSVGVQAGAITVFIRWRGAAERRAGFCPSLGLGGCRFLFGEFGWRRFRLARSLAITSLSVGAGLPSAAPDSARALDWAAADFCLANSVGVQAGAITVFIRWRGAAERRAGFCPSLGLGGCRFLFGEFGWRSGWRDHCLYPLARGCRAPRRILPEPWTGRLPISVWRIRLAFRLARSLSLSVGAGLPSAAPDSARALDWAAADFCLANSVGVQAGAITVFIRWRGAAERRAGFCPSLGLGGCRFLFGEFGWRSGWRDHCLYPLARGCRAPRRILPEPWTGRLPISVWRIRWRSACRGWRDHCLYPLARGCRAPRRILPEPWTGRLPISVWRIRLAFRLARSLSLSVGAGLPSAAPDSARALDWAAADFCLANSVGGSGWRDHCLYPLARGCRAPRRILPEPWTGRLPISVWRIRLAFRLARSLSLSVGAGLPSAAPDSARALDWAAADFCLANSVGVRLARSLSLSVGAGLPSAAPDSASSLGLGGCRFLFGECSVGRFQAGAITVFIRWRGAAERRAG